MGHTVDISSKMTGKEGKAWMLCSQVSDHGGHLHNDLSASLQPVTSDVMAHIIVKSHSQFGSDSSSKGSSKSSFL